MQALNSIPLLLGTSWSSGVNLYLTIAILGISHRLGWVTLPGEMDVIANPLVIIAAVIMYAVEFFADKIPYVDSIWDSIHTVIRPLGGGAMGYLAMSNFGPEAQVVTSLVTGSIAADSHLTKATTRVAINTSPEPVTNSIASLSEDGLVIVALWLVMKHPIIATILVIAFIVFSIWFLKMMFRFLKKIFRFFTGKSEVAPRGSDTAA